MIPTIVIPDPRGSEGREFEDQYKIWREAKEKSQPSFVIENVRHVHDPEWRTRVMSVTCAANQSHWIWVVTKWVFVAANLAFVFWKIDRFFIF